MFLKIPSLNTLKFPWHLPLFRISLIIFKIPWQIPDLKKSISSSLFPDALVTLNIIDTSHKFHYALDKYPTIHHFVTEMCTCIIVGTWDQCIVGFVQHVYFNNIWIIFSLLCVCTSPWPLVLCMSNIYGIITDKVMSFLLYVSIIILFVTVQLLTYWVLWQEISNEWYQNYKSYLYLITETRPCLAQLYQFVWHQQTPTQIHLLWINCNTANTASHYENRDPFHKGITHINTKLHEAFYTSTFPCGSF